MRKKAEQSNINTVNRFPVNPKRKEEVKILLQMTPEQIIQKAGEKLIVCSDLNALHQLFAEDMATELRQRNAQHLPTRWIVPVGPIGHYPILVEIINREKISLKNCWLFFMDEYCDDSGRVIPLSHPLSFHRIAIENFLSRLYIGHDLPPDHIIFPNESNIDDLAQMIDTLGGIDTCYGGIGIHGHIAFNEPEMGIAEKNSRKVILNPYTITINAIRAQVGGNLECFPNTAYTIGMKQILSARQIRLYCRNGTPYDWANTVLRIALFGEPGDDYPVTYIRDSNYVITTDRETLTTPKNWL